MGNFVFILLTFHISCCPVLSFRSNTFYGVFGVLDRLHNTDGALRNSEIYHRHRVLLNFGALEKNKY